MYSTDVPCEGDESVSEPRIYTLGDVWAQRPERFPSQALHHYAEDSKEEDGGQERPLVPPLVPHHHSPHAHPHPYHRCWSNHPHHYPIECEKEDMGAERLRLRHHSPHHSPHDSPHHQPHHRRAKHVAAADKRRKRSFNRNVRGALYSNNSAQLPEEPRTKLHLRRPHMADGRHPNDAASQFQGEHIEQKGGHHSEQPDRRDVVTVEMYTASISTPQLGLPSIEGDSSAGVAEIAGKFQGKRRLARAPWRPPIRDAIRHTHEEDGGAVETEACGHGAHHRGCDSITDHSRLEHDSDEYESDRKHGDRDDEHLHPPLSDGAGSEKEGDEAPAVLVKFQPPRSPWR